MNISQLRNTGKWIETQSCLILKLTFFSVHQTISKMFFGRQTGGSSSEEVWINTSYRMTELPSWNSGWDEAINTKIHFFSLGRIARWNCMHLTSIYQIWIYFLITKVFHVTGRIGNYRKNHQLKNQNEQLLIFFQSLSFFFRYIHSAYKIWILLFICLYSDIWNNITQYFLMFSL